jgi:hypothetical protein
LGPCPQVSRFSTLQLRAVLTARGWSSRGRRCHGFAITRSEVDESSFESRASPRSALPRAVLSAHRARWTDSGSGNPSREKSKAAVCASPGNAERLRSSIDTNTAKTPLRRRYKRWSEHTLRLLFALEHLLTLLRCLKTAQDIAHPQSPAPATLPHSGPTPSQTDDDNSDIPGYLRRALHPRHLFAFTPEPESHCPSPIRATMSESRGDTVTLP